MVLRDTSDVLAPSEGPPGRGVRQSSGVWEATPGWTVHESSCARRWGLPQTELFLSPNQGGQSRWIDSVGLASDIRGKPGLQRSTLIEELVIRLA